MASIKPLDLPDIEKLYETRMKQDFPPDELRPLHSIRQHTQKGHYASFGYAADNGDVLAYACFAFLPERRAAMLDYYAVSASRRGTGIGSAFIAQFHDFLAPLGIDHLLLEVESTSHAISPDDAILRRRRIRFYEKNDCYRSGVRSCLLGVHYTIMCLPFSGRPFTDDVLQDELRQIYMNIVKPLLKKDDVFEQRVKIWLLDAGMPPNKT